MREEKRIEPFLSKLAEMWKKIPDLRFAQVFTVIQIQAKEKFKVDDIYYLEENELENIIDDIIKNGEV
jgi:hypothetical protein